VATVPMKECIVDCQELQLHEVQEVLCSGNSKQRLGQGP
jgi:hypothetical protein